MAEDIKNNGSGKENPNQFLEYENLRKLLDNSGRDKPPHLKRNNVVIPDNSGRDKPPHLKRNNVVIPDTDDLDGSGPGSGSSKLQREKVENAREALIKEGWTPVDARGKEDRRSKTADGHVDLKDLKKSAETLKDRSDENIDSKYSETGWSNRNLRTKREGDSGIEQRKENALNTPVELNVSGDNGTFPIKASINELGGNAVHDKYNASAANFPAKPATDPAKEAGLVAALKKAEGEGIVISGDGACNPTITETTTIDAPNRTIEAKVHSKSICGGGARG